MRDAELRRRRRPRQDLDGVEDLVRSDMAEEPKDLAQAPAGQAYERVEGGLDVGTVRGLWLMGLGHDLTVTRQGPQSGARHALGPSQGKPGV